MAPWLATGGGERETASGLQVVVVVAEEPGGKVARPRSASLCVWSACTCGRRQIYLSHGLLSAEIGGLVHVRGLQCCKRARDAATAAEAMRRALVASAAPNPPQTPASLLLRSSVALALTMHAMHARPRTHIPRYPPPHISTRIAAGAAGQRKGGGEVMFGPTLLLKKKRADRIAPACPPAALMRQQNVAAAAAAPLRCLLGIHPLMTQLTD